MRAASIALILLFTVGCVTGAEPSDAAAAALRATTIEQARARGVVGVLSAVDGGGRQYCNGVALAPTFVLTASHCCRSASLAVLVPQALSAEEQAKTDFSKLVDAAIPVQRCYPRSPVDWSTRRVVSMDDWSVNLAIIKLSRPLPAGIGFAQPMPSQHIVAGAPIIDAAEYEALRLPLKSAAAAARVTQIVPPGRFVALAMAPMEASLPIHGFDSTRSAILFANVDEDLINEASSGAPVFVQDEGQDRLIGIISGGWRFAATNAAVATDIRPHLDWIRSILGLEP